MSLSTTKVVFLWFNLHDLKRFWPHKYLTSLTTILIFSILKIISCRKAIQTFLSETVNLSDETRSKYWSYTIPSCINCSRSYMAAFRHCSSSLLSSVWWIFLSLSNLLVFGFQWLISILLRIIWDGLSPIQSRFPLSRQNHMFFWPWRHCRIQSLHCHSVKPGTKRNWQVAPNRLRSLTLYSWPVRPIESILSATSVSCEFITVRAGCVMSIIDSNEVYLFFFMFWCSVNQHLRCCADSFSEWKM